MPRALLSTYDKAGVVDLARGLADLGWDLVSSGGTAAAIAEAGLAVTDTAELTGFPAILGHRVVTLHPLVHGGILADPDDAAHRADLDAHGIEPFDLVVVNLYPFSRDPSIELIDIGGPTLVRAAAKNHAHVGVVVDPDDYVRVLGELQRTGVLSASTRQALARRAFAAITHYDTAISTWMAAESGDTVDLDEVGDPTGFPATLELTYDMVDVALRYGENPHQAATVYRRRGAYPWWDGVVQHAGLALSYLNVYDADAAWGLAHDLAAVTGQPAVTIVKHANPCGASVGAELAATYQRAFDCDPRSAFGGIVALTEVVDEATVERMVAAAQADVVIAPGYAPGVVDALRAKRKNTRLLEAVAPTPDDLHLRPVTGGLLVQAPHRFVTGRAEWRVVTERGLNEAEWADAELAWRVCGWVASNAIVLVKDRTTWGIGAGQQNRVESGELAAAKAAGRAAGGACASDAFYPFPDGIEAAAAAGVAVIIQPGGSVRDDACIATANELGVAMVLTGERHFKH